MHAVLQLTKLIPAWFCERVELLAAGPAFLPPTVVEDMIENVTVWGVCDRYCFDNEVVVYSGVAGTWSRFLATGHDVSFLARIALGDMMFELGSAMLMGLEKGHPLSREGLLLDRRKTRKRLERDLRKAGGSSQYLGTVPRTDTENDCIAALHAFVDSCYPSNEKIHVGFEDPAHPQDLELSDTWDGAYTHPDDVPPGVTPDTLQSFFIPVGPMDSFDCTDWWKVAEENRFLGNRVGPSLLHNLQHLPFLNPPVSPVEVAYNLNEFPNEHDWSVRANCNSSTTHPFPVNGLWYGIVDDDCLPCDKGILRTLLGPLSPTLVAKLEWEGLAGNPDDVLQYNGHMRAGQPQGCGDLLYEGCTLYSGNWKDGCCAEVGKHLVGVKGFSIRQVFAYYQWRLLFELRLNADNPDCLEIRVLDMSTNTYRDIDVDWDVSLTVQLKTHHISSHALRLARRPEIGSAFIPYTTGCGTQVFTKLCPVLSKESGLTRVVTCVGPRETWTEDDNYEYVLFASDDNTYSMFQPLLQPGNCIGLEYVGNATKIDGIIPSWVALFESRDSRYVKQEGLKWPVTDAFVRGYFPRYVRVAMLNPNTMLDLVVIASQDRGTEFLENCSSVQQWHLPPNEDRVRPQFTYWVDRPTDLVKAVQGNVKNIYELMYVPGGRWRFFGRFNHDLPHVTTTWFQLPERWMEKFLKPACVSDMFSKATPFKRVAVHKTGNLDNRTVKDCVKLCVLAIVPEDDIPVVNAVRAWPDEVRFESTVGTLSRLNSISRLYQYNARKVPRDVLLSNFSCVLWDSDVDIIMRPTDVKGDNAMRVLCTVTYLVLSFPIPKFVLFLFRRLGVSRVRASASIEYWRDGLRAHG